MSNIVEHQLIRSGLTKIAAKLARIQCQRVEDIDESDLRAICDCANQLKELADLIGKQ